MKKIFISILCAMVPVLALTAQDLNSVADSILGDYYVERDGEQSKVRFTKESDGTYKAQVFWVKNDKDKNGKKRLDEKNPDKSLRNTPCDKILLVWNLGYNSGKKCWDGGKVYDPIRGIKANVKCSFGDDGKLKLRGSLLGISETVSWTKIK
ncbi:MAG: DUF2147 domain-containing protein [Bacteroidales bacterium]|nr:DUF2147 domain-containing protein [Bacteroides sp.]MCM1198827.1 DUF2147 domain-containing protein [Clostridium sp.]MCM1501253.1 DUF2147 domain-containing protein [Bacteroidales bacterium]